MVKFKFVDNDEELLKKVHKSNLGVVNVNGCIITYSFELQLDSNTYYINMELANGKYISRIKDLSKAFLNSNNNINTIDTYCGMIKRAMFSYKIVKYDNGVNIIYVFNDKYGELFNNIDNNKYTDLS